MSWCFGGKPQGHHRLEQAGRVFFLKIAPGLTSLIPPLTAPTPTPPLPSLDKDLLLHVDHPVGRFAITGE
ncbi:hypothetical protein CEP53_003834 [Fusarium sp. AF-6]|nr:hypothetical protein CEP53_003834 [Fusarium sp. AF-6]